jgi:hypothetical protein
MTKDMEMENTNGILVIFMMVSGEMIKEMVRAN